MIKGYSQYITEAKKAKGPTKLCDITGEEIGKNYDVLNSYYQDNYYSVDAILSGNYDEKNRNYITELLDAIKGKKIVFHDLKGDGNSKKERILVKSYWKHLNGQWNLYLVGSKSEYQVNLRATIGYYDDGSVITRKILDIDDEDDWDDIKITYL